MHLPVNFLQSSFKEISIQVILVTLFVKEEDLMFMPNFNVMEIIIAIVFVLAIIAVVISLLMRVKKKTKILPLLPITHSDILNEHVKFYQALSPGKKQEFEERMQQFLDQVKITGVNTSVEDLDKVLIAASAIIPIFGFPGWQYRNLNEVLLYPDSFDHSFNQQGEERNILGLVGDGAYHRIMILSQQELREAFYNSTGKNNTAIHEFVHLLDKSDGAIDGILENLLQQKYIMPWLQLMQDKIKQIMLNSSDINPYGATNPAEFFAVVSEYFFERPDLLQEKHPKLYELLSTIFRQEPDVNPED